MTIEIQELAIRVTVTDQPAHAEPDWQHALQRLKQELLELCQEEIQAQLQRAAER
jgi:hypothetical protein